MNRRGGGVAWLAGIAAAFFLSQAAAHFDGDEPRPRHRYRVSTAQGSVFWPDATQACTDHCNNEFALCPDYHSSPFDAPNDQWKCQCGKDGGTCGNPINFHTGTGNENHCAMGLMKGEAATATCVVGPPDEPPDTMCLQEQDEIHSWTADAFPVGFNVPEQGGLEAPWDILQGCSIILQSITGNGECTDVDYRVTGAREIDEDGVLTAQIDGNVWSNLIPNQCDPITGEIIGDWGQQGEGTESFCESIAGARIGRDFHWPTDDAALGQESGISGMLVCAGGCRARQVGSWICGTEDGAGGAPVGSVACGGTFEFLETSDPEFGPCTGSEDAGDGTSNPFVDGDGNPIQGAGGATDVTGIEDRLDELIGEIEGLTEPTPGSVDDPISGLIDELDVLADGVEDELSDPNDWSESPADVTDNFLGAMPSGGCTGDLSVAIPGVAGTTFDITCGDTAVIRQWIGWALKMGLLLYILSLVFTRPGSA